jgi:hypothetical protein
MKWYPISASLLLISCLSGTLHAQDEEVLPRDNFLIPPKPGVVGMFDAYTAGLQATLESRHDVVKNASMLYLRTNAVASLGFGEVGVHSDFRFLFFTIGGSFGGRRVWRTYTFEESEEGTRARRLDVDSEKAYQTKNWLYGEGRVRLAIPLPSALFLADHVVRYEGSPRNSYDWFHTNMHDGGLLFKFESTLFFRNQHWGGLGPTVRYMDLPRAGSRRGEWAAGFTYGVRPGLLKQNDLFLFRFLTRPGDPNFGFHILRAPIYTLLVYRMIFSL